MSRFLEVGQRPNSDRRGDGNTGMPRRSVLTSTNSLRAKAAGCGLWHPAVHVHETTKTWYVLVLDLLKNSLLHYPNALRYRQPQQLHSTNDLNYPITWNSLSGSDKNKLFFTSSYNCCIDHFNTTTNCRMVDYCTDTPSESPPDIIGGERPSNYDVDATNEMVSEYTSGWRPSEEEPTSCTNKAIPGTLWPDFMFRKTHIECCRDFFNLEDCRMLDASL